MPDLIVLCGIENVSPQSDQPLTKQLAVEIVASGAESTPKEEVPVT
jgi:hypothetical protein